MIKKIGRMINISVTEYKQRSYSFSSLVVWVASKILHERATESKRIHQYAFVVVRQWKKKNVCICVNVSVYVHSASIQYLRVIWVRASQSTTSGSNRFYRSAVRETKGVGSLVQVERPAGQYESFTTVETHRARQTGFLPAMAGSTAKKRPNCIDEIETSTRHPNVVTLGEMAIRGH